MLEYVIALIRHMNAFMPAYSLAQIILDVAISAYGNLSIWQFWHVAILAYGNFSIWQF